MPQPRSRSLSGVLPALAACCWLACAGTSTPGSDEEAARDPREGQRELLGATTPRAAAASQDLEEPPPDAPGTSAGRPGRLLVYSAITGHVPLEERPAYDPADRYRSPAEREAARARSIEAEIAEELAKQEALDVDETGRSTPAPPSPPSEAPFDAAANPLSAPPAPQLRVVPETLLATREMTIPAGLWQNRDALAVVRRSLDVDQDGRPEENRYFDAGTGLLVRAELDRDFDGTLDSWISYENGEPVVQARDDDGDGKPDVWERYQDGRASERTLDRDGDGVKDTFFRYEQGELAERLEDANNDGRVDKLERFAQRRRVSSEEDRTLNGSMDTWTTYGVVDGREVVASVQRDSRDQGKPDVFETYETSAGETRLRRKEEDVNGDGTIDVVSRYEDGKLVQRAISDEALSPL